MHVQIRTAAYDPWLELSAYQNASARLVPGRFGACVSFVGTMRDFNQGDSVIAMQLEHYPQMTERQLAALADTAMQQHDLLDTLILHRVGEVRPSDPIVLVAAWSAHRRQAFEACQQMMQELKSKATFWKKETLATRQRWVEG